MIDLAALTVAAYSMTCGAAFFGYRLFMYKPNSARVAPADAGLRGVEELEIVASDGTVLVAWYAPAKDNNPTILYFHGNSSNAAGRAPKINTILATGFGVFYLNNRGYGGSGGRPTERYNIADALATYDYVSGLGVPSNRMVVYGESLGTGQAVQLAAMRPVTAVILEAPLTSTIEVARRTYFWLPLRILITDTYQNERNIRHVTAPLLILHGKRDQVIPVRMGQRIYSAANEPKRIELFSHASHNDLFHYGAWERTHAFLTGA